MKTQSPVESYHQLKRQYPDTILLFRIGDFCEFFGEDATKVAAILGLTITTRKERGKPELPMAGFPYQSLQGNLVRLVQSGNRVAVVEQKPEGQSE